MHKLNYWFGVGLLQLGPFGFLHLPASSLFAAVPSSSNYTLKNYDIGSGGTSSSGSDNYKLNGVSGAQSGTTTVSPSYSSGSGVSNSQTSNVPPAPAFSNAGSYYDRLNLTVNTGNNPSDTKFLIAISSDNFVTTKYVQADNSISTSQAIANYQSYAAWGGSGGFIVLGLSPTTTYKVKVKALQGNFTGSDFGPTASATTLTSSLAVSLATSLTAIPPFAVGFSTLTAGSVVTGNADAIIGLSSNAANGGTIYIKDANSGLVSVSAPGTIASVTTNLTTAQSGYGAQVTTVSQTSGGPLASQAPFNGVSDNVGGLTTGLQPVIATTSPITGGSGTVRLKAKASVITNSASDYGDVVSFIIAMNF